METRLLLPRGRRTASAAGVEEQEGLRAEHLLLGGAADVRVAEVVPLGVVRVVGVEVAVAHVGRVVPSVEGAGVLDLVRVRLRVRVRVGVRVRMGVRMRVRVECSTTA